MKENSDEISTLKEEIESLTSNIARLESDARSMKTLLDEVMSTLKNHKHRVYDKTSMLDNPIQLGPFDSMATTSKEGFPIIPSCAGAATGVPLFTGDSNFGIPIVYDRTNNKLYAYNGAWKSVTLT